jgi:hypothetical protein
MDGDGGADYCAGDGEDDDGDRDCDGDGGGHDNGDNDSDFQIVIEEKLSKMLYMIALRFNKSIAIACENFANRCRSQPYSLM